MSSLTYSYAASTQVVASSSRELRTVGEVHGKVGFLLLCSRPANLAAILERFSSSLPPSFARGRRTALFTTRGTAQCGTPFVFLG